MCCFRESVSICLCYNFFSSPVACFCVSPSFSFFVTNISGLAVPLGPNAFVTRPARMRRGGLVCADLATSVASVESSNWDTVSVLGGFLSVSIRLDAYLWNTCGARRPSVLASNISGCTCICAPGRRPSCTASRRRRSVEPVVHTCSVVYSMLPSVHNLGWIDLAYRVRVSLSIRRKLEVIFGQG